MLTLARKSSTPHHSLQAGCQAERELRPPPRELVGSWKLGVGCGFAIEEAVHHLQEISA